MRILVVEDDNAIRETLVHVLESLGHRAYSAETQEETVKILPMVSPQVVLLDLLLNGDVATPLIPVIKAFHHSPSPRVVILSAMKDAEKVAKKEGVEFLAKPFNLEDLQRVIGGE